MNDQSVPRRDFLKVSGVLTGVLAAGGSLALLAPSRSWALELKSLTSAQGESLLKAARTIAPHDTLDDAAYALVIGAMDADATADDTTRALLSSGLQDLGAEFATLGEPARVAALKAVEQSAFFRYVRAKTLGTLYASPLAYAHFGYEGEAFSKGGYLYRGFNELKWLPDVPLADCGPVPGTAAR